MSAVIPIIITIIGIGVILWGIVSCQRQQQTKPSTNPPSTPPPQGGGVWQKMKSGRVLTIVISIALIGALAYGCSKVKFGGSSGAVGAIPPPLKPEIHLTVSNTVSRTIDIAKELGHGANYRIGWSHPVDLYINGSSTPTRVGNGNNASLGTVDQLAARAFDTNIVVITIRR